MSAQHPQYLTTRFLVTELKRLGRKTGRQAAFCAEWIENELRRRAAAAMKGVS